MKSPIAVRTALWSPRQRSQRTICSRKCRRPELTAKAVEAIRSGRYDLIVLNFANPDMVGHTGHLAAVIKAVETVDTGLGKIAEAIQSMDGALLVTADHGNCELMKDPTTGGPHTAPHHQPGSGVPGRRGCNRPARRTPRRSRPDLASPARCCPATADDRPLADRTGLEAVRITGAVPVGAVRRRCSSAHCAG